MAPDSTRPPSIGGYVPCFNSASTVRASVESLLGQTVRPREVIVVDDGSVDRPEEQLRDLPVRIVRHDRNLGRGAARARAMSELPYKFVLSCDATIVLDPAFAEKALPWFQEARVAAVFGPVSQPPARTVADRWRGRHLFKTHVPQEIRHRATLSTGGALMRSSAAIAAGGYDRRLRHSEDSEFGARLLATGFDVVSDPEVSVSTIAPNTVFEVLERYWRWHAGPTEAVSWRSYRKNVVYAVRALAANDVRDGDLLSVPVSLLTPHYQFWRSFFGRG